MHVRCGGGEAVFDVAEGVELSASQRMTMNELRKAQQLAEEHHGLILEKWHGCFG